MADNTLQNAKISYAKIKTSSGNTYGPFAFTADLNNLKYYSENDTGITITQEKSLKDILFGIYDEDIETFLTGQEKDESGNLIIKPAFYSFNADNSSFFQEWVKAKKSWDEDFFGIYMPDISAFKSRSVEYTSVEDFNVLEIDNETWIQFKENIDTSTIFAGQMVEIYPYDSDDITTAWVVAKTKNSNGQTEIRLTESWPSNATQLKIHMATIYNVDDNGNIVGPIPEDEFNGFAPGDLLGSFLRPAYKIDKETQERTDIERYLLVPFIQEGGQVGWRHVGKNENLILKYDLLNEANQTSLWQAIIESEILYNVIKKETYTSDTYAIVSQNDIKALQESGEVLYNNDSATLSLLTDSSSKNRLVTYDGLKDYSKVLQKYFPVAPGSGSNSLVLGNSGSSAGQKYSIVLGESLTTNKNNQVVVGKYNASDDKAIFIVGGGDYDNGWDKEYYFNPLEVYSHFSSFQDNLDSQKYISSYLKLNGDRNFSNDIYSDDGGATLNPNWIGHPDGKILRLKNTCGIGTEVEDKPYLKFWESEKGALRLVPSIDQGLSLGDQELKLGFQDIYTHGLSFCLQESKNSLYNEQGLFIVNFSFSPYGSNSLNKHHTFFWPKVSDNNMEFPTIVLTDGENVIYYSLYWNSIKEFFGGYIRLWTQSSSTDSVYEKIGEWEGGSPILSETDKYFIYNKYTRVTEVSFKDEDFKVTVYKIGNFSFQEGA